MRKTMALLTGATTMLCVAFFSGVTPATAGNWSPCGGGPDKTFMSVQTRGLPCSSAWILGEEALRAWDGFSRYAYVRGFKCRMHSGYPYHAGVAGTCKNGKQGAKFFTGD